MEGDGKTCGWFHQRKILITGIILLKVFVSDSGWVEVHDPNNSETHLQGFYNLKDVKEGTGFIVVQLKSGKVEVYDYHLSLTNWPST